MIYYFGKYAHLVCILIKTIYKEDDNLHVNSEEAFFGINDIRNDIGNTFLQTIHKKSLG